MRGGHKNRQARLCPRESVAQNTTVTGNRVAALQASTCDDTCATPLPDRQLTIFCCSRMRNAAWRYRAPLSLPATHPLAPNKLDILQGPRPRFWRPKCRRSLCAAKTRAHWRRNLAARVSAASARLRGTLLTTAPHLPASGHRGRPPLPARRQRKDAPTPSLPHLVAFKAGEDWSPTGPCVPEGRKRHVHFVKALPWAMGRSFACDHSLGSGCVIQPRAKAAPLSVRAFDIGGIVDDNHIKIRARGSRGGAKRPHATITAPRPGGTP